MAPALGRVSKLMMLLGGALVVAAIIFVAAVQTSGTVGVSAQASPTARPAAAAPAAGAARTATPAAAPGKLPSNGDSTTFPAVLIALLGAGLIGVGLTARYTFGKSRA